MPQSGFGHEENQSQLCAQPSGGKSGGHTREFLCGVSFAHKLPGVHSAVEMEMAGLVLPTVLNCSGFVSPQSSRTCFCYSSYPLPLQAEQNHAHKEAARAHTHSHTNIAAVRIML